MSVIKGTNAPVLAGTRRRNDPGRGWTTVLRYEFSDSASANAFGGAQANGTNVVEIDDRGPVYSVEVSVPLDSGNPEEPTERFEMFPVEVEKSLFEHPKFQALSETEQLLLRDWWAAQDGSVGPAVSTPDAIDIYTMMRNGTDHYSSPTVGFRFTQTVSDAYSSLGGTYNGVNTLFLPATLISSVGPPSLYAAAITAAGGALPAAATDYVKSWLKKQSTITTRGINRSDITQEWILENWSTLLYGSAA